MRLLKNVKIRDAEPTTYGPNVLSLEAFSEGFDPQSVIPVTTEPGTSTEVDISKVIGAVENLRLENNAIIGDLKLYGNPGYYEPLLRMGVSFSFTGTGVAKAGEITDYHLISIAMVAESPAKPKATPDEQPAE